MPILKTKNSFKPVFLYSNKDYSERLISQLKAEEENIKTAIQSIKKIRPHLDDEVINQCLRNGFEYFSKVIKKDHPDYPHAELSILLSLEGLKTDLDDEVKKNLSKIKKNQLIEYNISGDEVKLKAETVREIEKQSERFTTSKKQNEALETLIIIAENMNKAIENGIIHSSKPGSSFSYHPDLLSPFQDKMKLKKLDCGKWGIEPDPYRISMI